MIVEVVIPWRGGCPHRTAALTYVTRRYETAGLTVTIAEAPPGSWIKAAAVNPAVEASTADVIVVADADVWCDRTFDAITAVTNERADWAVPHERVHRLHPRATSQVLTGERDITDATLAHAEPIRLGAVGGGIVVGRRTTLVDVPLDSRFEGWGGEDFAWGIALVALAGIPWRSPAALQHLWHPPQPRRSRAVGTAENLRLLNRYQRDHTDPAAIRRLIDEAKEVSACLDPARRSSTPTSSTT